MTYFLEPDRATREAWVRLVSDYLNDYFDAAPGMDAYDGDADSGVLARLRRPPAETGRDLAEVLADIEAGSEGGILHPSGGHLSYIPNAGQFTAALGEFLAAGLNRYTGIAYCAPGLVAIEHSVVDWMTSLFGLGPDAAGVLLSGGSMANFTGVVTARSVKLGDDFTRGRIYLTAHTHHSVAKAARLAGFRADQIVKVAVDEDRHMDPEALREAIRADRAAGHDPFLVVASAGTTDTGAVDDLHAIADVAAEEGLWLHVDGAYGGFFILTDRGRSRLDGIQRADSLAVDPHKGMSLPFGSGAVLVRDESALVDAHLGRGAYLKAEDEYMGLRDIASLGPELSRPFRGMSVWLPLQLHGVAPFRDALDRSLDLAAYAYDRLKGIPGLEKVWRPDLSIVALRFADDEVGRKAMERVNSERKAHLSPTIVEGRFVLRIAVLNRRTTEEHIDHVVEVIAETLA
ncbi:MAG: aminotransferase class V-fold PLP-dependent enzyme [Actinomycetes bacterium]|jgi:aromatic-L-amino-acid decarboxylase